MKPALKLLSRVTLWVYLVIVPISFLLPPDVKERRSSSTFIMKENVTVLTGNLAYSRGLAFGTDDYSRAILSGTSTFEMTFEGRTCSWSLDSVLEGIESGEVQQTPIDWKVNLDAFVWLYIGLWISLGFLGVIFWWVGFFDRDEGKAGPDQEKPE